MLSPIGQKFTVVWGRTFLLGRSLLEISAASSPAVTRALPVQKSLSTSRPVASPNCRPRPSPPRRCLSRFPWQRLDPFCWGQPWNESELVLNVKIQLGASLLGPLEESHQVLVFEMSQDPLAPDYIIGPFAWGEVLQPRADEFAYLRGAALVVHTEVFFGLIKCVKI